MTAALNIPLVVNSVVQSAAVCPGGAFMLSTAASAFNSATVTLQVLLADGATYFSTSATAAANGLSAVVNIPAGAKVQATVTGGTPTGLYASLIAVPTNLN